MTVQDHHSLQRKGELELVQYARQTNVVSSLPSIALEAFHGIGLQTGEIEVDASPLDQSASIASWSAIFGVENHLWMDIVVEAQGIHAEKAFQKLTGSRTSSLSDAYDLLAEMVNFVCGGIRRVLTAEGESSVVFGTPVAVPRGNLHTIAIRPFAKVVTRLGADDLRVVVSVMFHKQDPHQKSLGELRAFDVSLESIPIAYNSSLEILAKGVVLSNSWIEKLRAKFLNDLKDRRITVVSPPPSTRLFLPGFL